MQVDLATRDSRRPSVARVLIELDVSKSPARRFWIGDENRGFWQKIDYEVWPEFCKFYDRTGHMEDSCYIRPKKFVWKEQPLQKFDPKEQGVDGHKHNNANKNTSDIVSGLSEGKDAGVVNDQAVILIKEEDAAINQSLPIVDKGKENVIEDDVHFLSLTLPQDPLVIRDSVHDVRIVVGSSETQLQQKSAPADGQTDFGLLKAADCRKSTTSS